MKIDRSYVAEWRTSWRSWNEAPTNGGRSPPVDVHSKVWNWAQENCQQKPFFIKSVSKTASHRPGPTRTKDKPYMTVPGPFIREHYRELQKDVLLESARDGSKWKVSFRAPHMYPNWVHGWPEFARDFDLLVEDILIFVMVANSHFLVTLFDKHGCHKSDNRNQSAARRSPSCAYMNDQAEPVLGFNPKEEEGYDNGKRCRQPAASTGRRPPKRGLPVRFAYEENGKCYLVVDSDSEDSRESSLQQGAGFRKGRGHRLQAATSLRVPKVEPDPEPPSKVDKILEYMRREYEESQARKVGRESDHEERCTSSDGVPMTTTRAERSFRGCRSDQEPLSPRTNNWTQEDHMRPSCSSFRPATKKLESRVVTKRQNEGEQRLQKGKKACPEITDMRWGKLKGAPYHTTSCDGNSHSEFPKTISGKGLREEQGFHIDPLSFRFISKRRMPNDIERQQAKTAGNRYAELLKGPNFMLVMGEIHVYKGFILEIPQAFVEQSTLLATRTALRLIDSTGQTWDAPFHLNNRNRVAVDSRKWAHFALHHLLETGDVVVFELTDVEACTVLVRIFRVVQIPKLDRKPFHDHYRMIAA